MSSHGTKTALVEVPNAFVPVCGNGLVSVLILLDPTVSFDPGDSSVLLPRLVYVTGIRGTDETGSDHLLF